MKKHLEVLDLLAAGKISNQDPRVEEALREAVAFCRKSDEGSLSAQLSATQAEIERLQTRNEKIELELQEWICANDLRTKLENLRTAAEQEATYQEGSDRPGPAARLRAAIEASR